MSGALLITSNRLSHIIRTGYRQLVHLNNISTCLWDLSDFHTLAYEYYTHEWYVFYNGDPSWHGDIVVLDALQGGADQTLDDDQVSTLILDAWKNREAR